MEWVNKGGELMKKRKIALGISIILVLILMVTACGKKSDTKMSYDTATTEYKVTANSVKTQSTSMNDSEAAPTENRDVNKEVEYVTVKSKAEEASGLNTEASLDSQNNFTNIQDKIIRRFNLEVETQEFDT